MKVKELPPGKLATCLKYYPYIAESITLPPSSSYSGGKKQPLNLSVYNVQATNIPPKETLVYTKQTQTTSTGGHERDGAYTI